MVYDRFIHRSALLVTLSFCVVVSATNATAQQAEKKETKPAQQVPDKQASQNRGKAKSKEAKPAVVKAKVKPRKESPVKAPPSVAKSKTKPAVAKAKPKPKKDTPVKAAVKKTPALSKSKQAAKIKKAAGAGKAKAAETKKTKAVASGTKPKTKKTKAVADGAVPEKKTEIKKVAKIGLQQAKALLASAESEKVKQGLKHLKAIGKPTITAPIVARLRQGLPPALVESAIDALVEAKNAKAAQVLVELFEHRRASIRASAISALGSLKVRKAYAVVREALDDSDASVRAAAAKALSQVGGRKALKDLYLVFEGGNTDVVTEIAKWVTTRDADKLTGYLKDYSFRTLQPAFVEILNKKSTSVRAKTKLISRLGEVGTPDIQQFLRDYRNDLPKVGRKPLMDAIGKALQNAQKIETTEPEPEAKQNKEGASKKEEAK